MSRDRITLYQTLANRHNPSEIEKHGPYKCTNKKRSWLGVGYYFGDTFIELAHWWGNFGGCHNGNYIICESIRPYDEEVVFDLHDNVNHINDFKGYYYELLKTGEYTVSGALEHLKRHTNFCDKYIAIRIRGDHSTSSIPNSKVPFILRRKPFYNLVPPIQICYFNCPDISKWDYRVIYPEEYAHMEEMIF